MNKETIKVNIMMSMHANVQLYVIVIYLSDYNISLIGTIVFNAMCHCFLFSFFYLII